MTTIYKLQTTAAGLAVGDREVLGNPKEPRTRAFLEKVL